MAIEELRKLQQEKDAEIENLRQQQEKLKISLEKLHQQQSGNMKAVEEAYEEKLRTSDFKLAEQQNRIDEMTAQMSRARVSEYTDKGESSWASTSKTEKSRIITVYDLNLQLSGNYYCFRCWSTRPFAENHWNEKAKCVQHFVCCAVTMTDL
jgi:hypothetical protein